MKLSYAVLAFAVVAFYIMTSYTGYRVGLLVGAAEGYQQGRDQAFVEITAHIKTFTEEQGACEGEIIY